MANILFRVGKTPIQMKLADDNPNYKRVAIVTDTKYEGHKRLIPDTRFVENKTIFFVQSTQIHQLYNIDLVIIDDVDHVLEIKCPCPKVYMYGIMNEDFKKNIPKENIVSYTYQDYLDDGNSPVLKLLKTEKTYPKVFE